MQLGRRMKLIINPGYQWRFIAAFTVLSMTGVAFAFVCVMLMIGSGLEDGIYRSHITLTAAEQVVMPIAVKANLALAIAGLVFQGLLSLFFAMRTQSMVEGLGTGLAMLRQGKMDFCFNDESRHDFPELDEAFNVMMADNRVRLAALTDAVEKMGGPVKILCGPDEVSGPARAAAAAEIKRGTDELFAVLDEFQL